MNLVVTSLWYRTSKEAGGGILSVEFVEKLFQRGAVIVAEFGKRADSDIVSGCFDLADMYARIFIDGFLRNTFLRAQFFEPARYCF